MQVMSKLQIKLKSLQCMTRWYNNCVNWSRAPKRRVPANRHWKWNFRLVNGIRCWPQGSGKQEQRWQICPHSRTRMFILLLLYCCWPSSTVYVLMRFTWSVCPCSVWTVDNIKVFIFRCLTVNILNSRWFNLTCQLCFLQHRQSIS